MANCQLDSQLPPSIIIHTLLGVPPSLSLFVQDQIFAQQSKICFASTSCLHLVIKFISFEGTL